MCTQSWQYIKRPKLSFERQAVNSFDSENTLKSILICPRVTLMHILLRLNRSHFTEFAI